MSSSFSGLKVLDRHRLVNAAAKSLLQDKGSSAVVEAQTGTEEKLNTIHALSVVAKDEEQYKALGGEEGMLKAFGIEYSPKCRGGGGS